MSGHDGFIYPEWSGLNDSGWPVPPEAIASAIETIRYVWRDDSRQSREMLARLITGSECITVLYALEGAMRALSPSPNPHGDNS